MTTRTYMFAGGGTGGHLFPGIAVAQELLRRESNARVLFVGSERDLERSILSRHEFEHQSLPVESLRTLTRQPLRFAIRNWHAWRAARRLIREERPAAVIGLGGYASAPIVWAASRAKIPVILMEQNLIPGRTTRWLASSATIVCITFPESTAYLPRRSRVVCTGNPLRREITTLSSNASHPAPDGRPGLLILGGSQGAESLNDAVIDATRLLRLELAGWQVVHQSGPRQVDEIRTTYGQLGLAATVEPFFEDMAKLYSSAALVISRAGATTLAELACCSLPMVLVPYPRSADDHQRANAISLRDHGAAVVVEQKSTAQETGSLLAEALLPLLADPGKRREMSICAHGQSHPGATSQVADQIQNLVNL